MTIKQAIQKAIDNGWKYNYDKELSFEADGSEKWGAGLIQIDGLLLDPKFWEALGKAKEWKKDSTNFSGFDCEVDYPQSGYIVKMHEMIEHLIDGKTIEEYFKTL